MLGICVFYGQPCPLGITISGTAADKVVSVRNRAIVELFPDGSERPKTYADRMAELLESASRGSEEDLKKAHSLSLFLQGLDLYMEGKADDAKGKWQQAQQADPTNVYAIAALGSLTDRRAPKAGKEK